LLVLSLYLSKNIFTYNKAKERVVTKVFLIQKGLVGLFSRK